MGEAPQTHTVTRVVGDKVVLSTFNGEIDLLPKGTLVQEGQQIRGWLNEKGKYGPYIKVAEERQQGSSNGSKDEFARRPENVENVRRMKHTACMSAAPAYYELLRAEGVLLKGESKEKVLEILRGLIRWLEDTYPVPDDELPFS